MTDDIKKNKPCITPCPVHCKNKPHEPLTDQFLKRNGIEKDKDGTPDIVGKVMGDYHKTLKRTFTFGAVSPALDKLNKKVVHERLAEILAE